MERAFGRDDHRESGNPPGFEVCWEKLRLLKTLSNDFDEAAMARQEFFKAFRYSHGTNAVQFPALLQMHAVVRPTTYCEVGFHLGTSSLAAACAAAESGGQLKRIVAFDKPLTGNKKRADALGWLRRQYPDIEFQVVDGDSTKTVRSFRQQGICDMIFVDGDHSFEGSYADVQNVQRLAAPPPSGLLLMDDCWPMANGIGFVPSQGPADVKPPSQAFRLLVEAGRVRSLLEEPKQPEWDAEIQQRDALLRKVVENANHAIMRLPPPNHRQTYCAGLYVSQSSLPPAQNVTSKSASPSFLLPAPLPPIPSISSPQDPSVSGPHHRESGNPPGFEVCWEKLRLLKTLSNDFDEAAMARQEFFKAFRYSHGTNAVQFPALLHMHVVVRPTTYCEVGFHLGTSSLAAACAAAESGGQLKRIIAFDKPLTGNKKRADALGWLRRQYPDIEFQVVDGDSTKTVRSFRQQGICDMIFVDGDHSFEGSYADVQNVQRLAAPPPSGLLLMDDCWPMANGIGFVPSQGPADVKPPSQAFRLLVEAGRVRSLLEEPKQPEWDAEIQQRDALLRKVVENANHAIMRLPPPNHRQTYCAGLFSSKFAAVSAAV